MNKRLLLLLLIWYTLPTYAITLVYSMRIRRAFVVGLSALLHREKKSAVVATAVPIIYTRSRNIVDPALNVDLCERRTIGGSIINLRYIPSRAWWCELTTGIEKEKLVSQGTAAFTASRTGFDDFVFTFGHNFFPTDDIQLVLYGLTGIPSKNTVTAQEATDTLVGTRFFSAGIGGEISYALINTLKTTLIGIAQARFLHFFNRKWQPILPCDAVIIPGNVTDLLLSMQFRHCRTTLEIGYNPTFFTDHGARLSTGVTKTPNYVRHSFYTTVAHVSKKVSFLENPLIVGAGFNIGASKRFDTNILSYWVTMSYIF